jgi:hypothetical protein
MCINESLPYTVSEYMRGADKSLARHTSRCIFLMVRIFPLMLVLLYRVSQNPRHKIFLGIPHPQLSKKSFYQS